MNIFFVDTNPILAAQSLPDKLVVKMVLETAQLLSTAHRVLDGNDWADAHCLYKATHINHPCSIWVRTTHGNYNWLWTHFCALSDEYTYRYQKKHKSFYQTCFGLSITPENIPTNTMTPPAQAMPDKYKNSDPVLAYRQYMINEKHYAKWEKTRGIAAWWK